LEDVLVGRGGVNEASILFAGGAEFNVVSSWEPFEPEVLREEDIVGVKEENLDKYNSVMNFTSFVQREEDRGREGHIAVGRSRSAGKGRKGRGIFSRISTWL